jgi:hypothetical protein
VTASKNEGSKRGDMALLANQNIEYALLGMDTWIGKYYWENGLGQIFLDFRDFMQRYYFRSSGQSIRHAQGIHSATPMRTADNALKSYVREPRKANKNITPVLRRQNTKLENAIEYDIVDVNDYIEDMSRSQQHMYLLQMQQGMFVPIFHYTWSWGGSRAGVNPHVIWRIPPLSDKEARDEGMNTSQKNIEYLNKNTSLYHSRVEHTAFMPVVVNKNFVCSIVVA